MAFELFPKVFSHFSLVPLLFRLFLFWEDLILFLIIILIFLLKISILFPVFNFPSYPISWHWSISRHFPPPHNYLQNLMHLQHSSYLSNFANLNHPDPLQPVNLIPIHLLLTHLFPSLLSLLPITLLLPTAIVLPPTAIVPLAIRLYYLLTHYFLDFLNCLILLLPLPKMHLQAILQPFLHSLNQFIYFIISFSFHLELYSSNYPHQGRLALQTSWPVYCWDWMV